MKHVHALDLFFGIELHNDAILAQLLLNQNDLPGCKHTKTHKDAKRRTKTHKDTRQGALELARSTWKGQVVARELGGGSAGRSDLFHPFDDEITAWVERTLVERRKLLRNQPHNHMIT